MSLNKNQIKREVGFIQMMSTEHLIGILKVRQECDTNPTSQSLLYELSLALEKLKKYEDAEAENLKRAIATYLTNPHTIE